MTDFILCINTGSSSVKFALFDQTCQQIHSKHYQLETDFSTEQLNASARDSIQSYITDLASRDVTLSTIKSIAHRFVFGGTTFTQAVLIENGTLDQLQTLSAFAPLHMPTALAFLEASRKLATHTKMTAHFDTAFHHTLPKVNAVYALPYSYTNKGIRRFGFHGLSYSYITQQLQRLSTQCAGRWIIAHLGSGASLCGIKNSQSQICTMGFSPLDGLPMASRCGQIDPGVMIHLLRNEHLSINELESLLYQQSGLLALSGESRDWQTVRKSDSGDSHFAVEYFLEQTIQHIGKIAAHLQGIDGIVFTGGIGENDQEYIQQIMQRLNWLGVTPLEKSLVDERKLQRQLSAPTSKVEVWMIPTQEESIMAQESINLTH